MGGREEEGEAKAHGKVGGQGFRSEEGGIVKSRWEGLKNKPTKELKVGEKMQ